jgi:hypothetical protein
MKIYISKSFTDMTPLNICGDLIALACILVTGVLLVLGGAALGMNHCMKTKCYGYENAHQPH